MASRAAYARAEKLVAETLSAFLPPTRTTVAEYAAQHRFLANEGGGFVGRWSHAEAPYLLEPMEVLSSPDYLTCAIVGPGQSGKTETAQNWLLHSVGNAPGDMLWYMQTEPAVESYVKGRINPMIDAHPVLRENQGLRPVDDSLHFKRFRTMKVEFLAAVASNLINKSAPRIVADEIDAYPKSLGGSVRAQLDVRRQTFGRDSMLLMISHPDLARGLDPSRDWAEGIMAVYADSDRRAWWWPCPHCGAWSSSCPTASRVCTLEYPQDGTLDEIEAKTVLVCPVNGCAIEFSALRAMNLRGRWLRSGQEIDEEGQITGHASPRDTAGFWITGIMSPFTFGGWGGLARARVKAERDAESSGDDSPLREVMVKRWGVPYAAPRAVGSLDATTLAQRAEPGLALGQVPEGVRFLTAAADVQGNRFEVLIRGWGERGESWVIATRKIEADPAVSPDDWDRLLALMLDGEWPLADGSERVMRVRACGYDTGGAPGVTAQAYDAWRRWRARRKVIMRGKLDGRDAWNVIPLKGLGGLNASRLSVVYPDTARKDRRVAAGGQVPIGQFNANAFKDDLAGQLARADAGPWHVHIPAALASAEPPHVWFEQLVSEQRRPNGAWERTERRNEALDLMVMTHVVAHLHGLARIAWDRPPAWASAWDTNPLVGAPTPVASTVGAPGSGGGEVTAPLKGPVAGAWIGTAPPPSVQIVGAVMSRPGRVA